MRQSAGVLLLLAVFLGASTADASFPGRNGLIAFQRDSRPCKIRAGNDGRDYHCPAAIWTANLDGSNERRLTTGDDAYVPAWSRDGKRIAYVRYVGYRALLEVWVMNADGSGKRRLHAIKSPLLYSQGLVAPSWSPDGSTILVPGIVVLPGKPKPGYVHNSRPAVIALPTNGAPPIVLFKVHAQSVSSPQFSPSGKLVAYIATRSGARSVLYVSRPDGSGVRTLATAAGGSTEGRELDWSPDGRRIVFVRRILDNGGYGPELHVINVSGSGLRQLTKDGADVFHSPTWAPDGRSIVFKSGGRFDEDGQPSEQGEQFDTRFAIVDPDGSGVHLAGPPAKDCSGGTFKAGCRLVGPAWQPR